METRTPFQIREGMHAPAVRRASLAEVPIVDFGALYSPSPTERRTMAREIRAACAGPGFFYIVNHQFPQAVIARAQGRHAALLRAPGRAEDAQPLPRLAQPTGATCRRWDHGGPQPRRLQRHLGGHRDGARPACGRIPTTCAASGFYGPNNWPAEPADFRWALGTYFDCQLELGRQIFRAFEYALDVEEGYFTSKYSKPLARLASALRAAAGAPRHRPYRASAPTLTTSASPPSGRTGKGCRC